MKRTLVLFFVFIPLLLFAAVGNWQTYTNSSEIRQFVIADSIIWSATNGGVLQINANTNEYKKFTNTEGLSQIDVVAIAHDPKGYVWVAMPDGLLQWALMSGCKLLRI